MDTIILPPKSLPAVSDRANSVKRPRISSFSASRDQSISWGRRHHHGSWLQAVGCAGIMLLCPCLVIFYWISLTYFAGSISAAGTALLELGFVNFTAAFAPRADLNASIGYASWVLFQVVLYQFLPSKISTGQLTPAGHLLKYRTNGLSAWIFVHVAFVALSYFEVIDPAILAKNWAGLLIAANIYGFVLSAVAYVKACKMPTHEGDCKFSGSMLYDMYMGVELNPRIGEQFDFKLFHNGRPGIVAWTLIDLSFVAYQYQLHGFITNSIVIATALHMIYVVDFFVNEDWYLRTIDICHDHFGFYLAWGSMVWLPSMYTLQTQYLAQNPVVLSSFQATAIFCAGLSGYILFRSVNYQKDLVRSTNGKCQLWGQPAKLVRVKYMTKDGREHNSILLCSGWWGYARHVNYLGDLVLSYSMCAACGITNLLPWTYAIFMTILLIHRCWRDEERCSKKYGKGWADYCKKVPWVIIPGIY